MQRLAGNLRTIDPEASESLRIVSYFDVLISRGAPIDALLRGAAVMANAVAGATVRGRTIRRDADGGTPQEEIPTTSSRIDGGEWSTWIERHSAPAPLDDVILERLALGIALIESRRRLPGGVEAVIDAGVGEAERVAALARLRIDPGASVRVIASPAGALSGTDDVVILPTRRALVQVRLDRELVPPTASGRWGLGTVVRADRAPESLDTALIALRLTDERDRIVDAAELGSLLLLARAFDADHPPADVVALAALDERSRHVLRALVEAESMRSASAALGMHHSSVQARHESLTQTLGYDPRTPLGRARYVAAALVMKLAELAE